MSTTVDIPIRKVVPGSRILCDEDWEKIKPLGIEVSFISRETVTEDVSETVMFSVVNQNTGEMLIFNVIVPIFNDNVIFWRNSVKALLFEANVDPSVDESIFFGDINISNRMKVDITSPRKLAIRGLEVALSSAIRPWFYKVEEDVDPVSVQVAIDKWFSTSVNFRTIKHNPYSRAAQNAGVIINPGDYDGRHYNRMINRVINLELCGIIDPLSTSVGDKVNTSFRISSGAVIDSEGNIVPSQDKSLSSIVSDPVLALDSGLIYNPRRAYLLRTSIDNSVPFLKDINDYKSEIGIKPSLEISTIGIPTLIANKGFTTYEDSIEVTQAAADMMTAVVTKPQLIESGSEIYSLVKVGDMIRPGEVIALDDGNEIRASKLHYPSTVAEVVVSKGNRFGEKTNRLWIRFDSYYPLLTGDKITNKHGGKGIVTVISGDKPLIVISPESVIGRKSVSVLFEIQEASDFEVTPEGLKGTMQWMRLDKFAKEIAVYQTGRRKKNNFGGFLDSAKESGQRCNTAKLLALSNRGYDHIAKKIIKDNQSAIRHFRGLIRAVQNNRFIVT